VELVCFLPLSPLFRLFCLIFIAVFVAETRLQIGFGQAEGILVAG
jgi:hypothetical protein